MLSLDCRIGQLIEMEPYSAENRWNEKNKIISSFSELAFSQEINIVYLIDFNILLELAFIPRTDEITNKVILNIGSTNYCYWT